MAEEKIRDNILKAVENLKEELVQLVCDTVRIPSVNLVLAGTEAESARGGESAVNHYLASYMRDMGLSTDLWEEEPGRANLVGTCKGAGKGRSLIFNGHVDVVPPGDPAAWTVCGPWDGLVAEGRIWGRGAADMKGGNAAAIIALKGILQTGYKPLGNVYLENVVGEEMMEHTIGTSAAVKRGYTADAAIVVEPSEPPHRLGIIPACCNVGYMVCTVPGKATHACLRDEVIRPGGAGAEIGVSSIDKAVLIYQGLRQLEEEWGQSKRHPLYARPGHFTIHPGVITGGPTGAFSISAESRLEYSIWAPPQETEEEIKTEIETHIARICAIDPWLRENPPKIEWPAFWPSYDLPVSAPICRAAEEGYRRAFQEEPHYYGFVGSNDASFLSLVGIPTITWGPGNLRVAHAPNEYVEIADLVDAAKAYSMIILEWCGVA
jgi:acetylornithine deacetylase/succinyl-diaminopimelate desuccinylase family protein